MLCCIINLLFNYGGFFYEEIVIAFVNGCTYDFGHLCCGGHYRTGGGHRV